MSDNIKISAVCEECGAALENTVRLSEDCGSRIKITVRPCTSEHKCEVREKKKSCLTCSHHRHECDFSLGSSLEQTSFLKPACGKDCDGWTEKEREES